MDKATELENRLAAKRLVKAGTEQRRLGFVFFCRGAARANGNKRNARSVPIGPRQAVPGFQQGSKDLETEPFVDEFRDRGGLQEVRRRGTGNAREAAWGLLG